MVHDARRERVVLFGPGTWIYGPLAPATAQVLGAACTGTNGPPLLTSDVPFHGNESLVLDLLSARASSACLFGLSATSQNLPIGGGCTLYLKDMIPPSLGATNVFGFASTKLAVPLDRSLRGVTLYAQAFVEDPLGGPLGLTSSAGRRLVIGD
jgi:hypothetical protein